MATGPGTDRDGDRPGLRRGGDAGPGAGRRRGGGVPARAARGDPEPGGGAAAGARRPAHRVGQERGLLRRHRDCCARRGAGPTLLVSPLLGLMRNQIEAAERGGVRAATINSANQADWEPIEARARGRRDRRAAGLARAVRQRPRSATTSCRPSRRRSRAARGRRGALHQRLGPRLPPRLPAHRAASSDAPARGVPVLCTTATANDRVVADVSTQLGDGLVVLRGPLDRESLALDVIALPSPGRAPGLARDRRSRRSPGSGIVYTLTVADAERVAAWLQLQGIAAQRLHRRDRRPSVKRGDRAGAPRATSSRWSSRPPRSAWGTTSPTSRS